MLLTLQVVGAHFATSPASSQRVERRTSLRYLDGHRHEHLWRIEFAASPAHTWSHSSSMKWHVSDVSAHVAPQPNLHFDICGSFWTFLVVSCGTMCLAVLVWWAADDRPTSTSRSDTSSAPTRQRPGTVKGDDGYMKKLLILHGEHSKIM